MEVFNSLLIIGLMVWIVCRIFILTKRIVQGWDYKKKANDELSENDNWKVF